VLRLLAGRHRGRKLLAPEGLTTRPTAERVRQALFDMLWHSPWAGREVLGGAQVVDAFAGTGALGLEALSRGAAHVTFFEKDRAALAALRANIAATREDSTTRIIPGDVLRPPRATHPATLVLLDPPYGQNLVPQALAALNAAGWITPDTLIAAELGKTDTLDVEPLAERSHGAARLVFWRGG